MEDDIRFIVRDEIANLIFLGVGCIALGWFGAWLIL
jgi:hypothetical protein